MLHFDLTIKIPVSKAETGIGFRLGINSQAGGGLKPA
jgi:hypothetical protein